MRNKTRASELASTVALSIDAESVYEMKDKVVEIYNSVPNKVTSDYWGTELINENEAEIKTSMNDDSLKP